MGFLDFIGFLGYTGFLGFIGLAGIVFTNFCRLYPHKLGTCWKEEENKCITPWPARSAAGKNIHQTYFSLLSALSSAIHISKSNPENQLKCPTLLISYFYTVVEVFLGSKVPCSLFWNLQSLLSLPPVLQYKAGTEPLTQWIPRPL